MKKFKIEIRNVSGSIVASDIREAVNLQNAVVSSQVLINAAFKDAEVVTETPQELIYAVRINEIVPKVEPTYYQVTDHFDTELGQVFKQAGNYVDEEGKVIGVALVDKEDEPMFYIFEQVTLVTLPY